jgi:hypothetical protein
MDWKEIAKYYRARSRTLDSLRWQLAKAILERDEWQRAASGLELDPEPWEDREAKLSPGLYETPAEAHEANMRLRLDFADLQTLYETQKRQLHDANTRLCVMETKLRVVRERLVRVRRCSIRWKALGKALAGRLKVDRR